MARNAAKSRTTAKTQVKAKAPVRKPAAKPTKAATTKATVRGTKAKVVEALRGTGPVFVSFAPAADGGGTLRVEYSGLLAAHTVVLRIGERRAGRDWVNGRDVAMARVGERAVAEIKVDPGESFDGALFAFHAEFGGQQHWDNAGHAFGAYSFDVRTGDVAPR